MFSMVRRYGVMAALMIVGLMLITACGGSSAATPVGRVDSFVKDMNSAFNDPKLSEASVQEKWADTLSKYYLPEQQAEQKAQMLEGLKVLPSGSFKIEGAKFEAVSENGDAAEVKAVAGKTILNFAGETQEEELTTSGIGGSGSANLKLKKVDGQWYINQEN